MTRKLQRCLAVSLSAALATTPAVVYAQGPFARLTGFFTSNQPYSQQQHQQPVQQAFVVTDQPRSSEIAVELAWLSDPMTFPYALSARNTGNGLQVEGFVPSEAVRQRALFLAKRNTTLPVFDGTKVHAGLAAPQPAGGGNVPAHAAAAIRSAFPEHANHLRVNAGNNGSVTVSGMVGSYEEKLALSQALRQVPGCTSVVNTVQVHGASYGQSSSQQQYQQPYQPQTQNMTPRPSGPPSMFKNALAFFGFGPSPLQNQNNQMPGMDQQRVQGQPNMAAANQSAEQTAYSSPNGNNYNGSPYNSSPYNGSPYNTPYNASPYNVTPPSGERSAETSWRTSAPPAIDPGSSTAQHTVQVTNNTHEPYAPPVRNVRANEPPLYGDGPPVIARSDKKNEPQPLPQPPVFKHQTPEPLLIEDAGAGPGIQKYTPPTEPIERSTQPTPAPQPPTQTAQAPKLPPHVLKQRIERIVAGSARNISVENDKSGKLVIRLTLADGVRDQQVIDRVVNMPELAPYQDQLQLNLEMPTPPPSQQQPQIIDEVPSRPR